MDTIIASALSSRTKLLLICLILQQKNGKCRICQNELSRLTSTSIRHLSRIIRCLEQEKLLRITRRPGQCHTYILPSRYFLQENQLVADWATKKELKNQQYNTQKKGKEWRNPALVQNWQSTFLLKYQPVSREEQKAMDYMVFANNTGKLSAIKSPVAYCKTLVRNGHPLDFPSFFERQKNKQRQHVRVKKEKEHEQNEFEYKWHTYTNLSNLQQKKYRKNFKSKFLTSQPRQVVDIFKKSGFGHPMINALYKSFVVSNIT